MNIGKKVRGRTGEKEREKGKDEGARERDRASEYLNVRSLMHVHRARNCPVREG